MIDKSELLKIVKQINPAAKDGTDLIRKGILDSLDVISLVVKLEAAYGIEISPVYIDEENFSSIDSIAKLIERCYNEISDSAISEELLNFDVDSYINMSSGSVRNKNMFASELQLNVSSKESANEKNNDIVIESAYKFDVMDGAENVIQLLEYVSAELSSKAAVKDSSGEISFEELVSRSKRIASHLIRMYGSDKAPIFIVVRRNIKSIVMMLAVILSGNYYVCVDESLSKKKIKDLLETVNPKCILWDYNSKSDFLFDICDDIEIYDEIIDSKADSDLLSKAAGSVKGKDPLYGVFTSGTTGNPKCIVKRHDKVISFISEYVDLLGLKADDVLGSKLSMMFDAFSKDLYSMIFCGATLILMPTGSVFPKDDAEMIIKHRISTVVWTPSLFKNFAKVKIFDSYSLGSLKNVLFVGDLLPASVINYWRIGLPGATFINLYGTSEMTGNCLYQKIEEDCIHDYVPLDSVFTGYEITLEDKGSDEAGESELLVKGSLMASWLLDNSGMHEVDENSFYKTGDYFVKQGKDLVFCGRKDDYFKHDGYRVSPMEVESAFRDIQNCGTLVCFHNSAIEEICVVWDGEASLEETIKKRAEEVLPKYMRPNRYIHLESVPVNDNGKISRMEIAKCVQSLM